MMATHNADIVNSLLKRVLVLEKGVLTRDDHRGNKKPSHATEEKEKKHHKEEKEK